MNDNDTNRGNDGVHHASSFHNLNSSTADLQLRSGASGVSDPLIASQMVQTQQMMDNLNQQLAGGASGAGGGSLADVPWKKLFGALAVIALLVVGYQKGSQMYRENQYQQTVNARELAYLSEKLGATEAKALLAARKAWGNYMIMLSPNDNAILRTSYEWTSNIPFSDNKAAVIARAIESRSKPLPVLQAAALECMHVEFCRPGLARPTGLKLANPEAIAALLYKTAIAFEQAPGLNQRERESICRVTALTMRDSAYAGVPGASLQAAVARMASCYEGTPSSGDNRDITQSRAALKIYLAEGGTR